MSRLRFVAVSAVLLAVCLAGCGDRQGSLPAPSPPSPSLPSPSLPSPDSSTVPTPSWDPGRSPARGQGLDVRYLDDDGTVKDLPVEDFAR